MIVYDSHKAVEENELARGPCSKWGVCCRQSKAQCQAPRSWGDACVLSYRTSVAGEQGGEGQRPVRQRSRQWLGFLPNLRVMEVTRRF